MSLQHHYPAFPINSIAWRLKNTNSHSIFSKLQIYDIISKITLIGRTRETNTYGHHDAKLNQLGEVPVSRTRKTPFFFFLFLLLLSLFPPPFFFYSRVALRLPSPFLLSRGCLFSTLWLFKTHILRSQSCIDQSSYLKCLWSNRFFFFFLFLVSLLTGIFQLTVRRESLGDVWKSIIKSSIPLKSIEFRSD